jgi:hypothetical protein
MPRKTKRGGSCSLFGKKNKSEKKDEIKKLIKDLPDNVTSKLLVLLKKDPNIITDKLKGVKLEEFEKQYTKYDEELTNEISQEKNPEIKVSKYIDVRRKQLEKVNDPMIYSTQEINILMEELNKLEKVLSATPISKTETSVKNANVTNAKINAKNSSKITNSKNSKNAKVNANALSSKLTNAKNETKRNSGNATAKKSNTEVVGNVVTSPLYEK